MAKLSLTISHVYSFTRESNTRGFDIKHLGNNNVSLSSHLLHLNVYRVVINNHCLTYDYQVDVNPDNQRESLV